MNISIIDKTMFRKMPWANGGGVTTELFVRTDERSGRILWRLSMAGVDTDGPFSHFDGYDRILVLMQGRGLRLGHRDGTEHDLAHAYDMAAFPGDAGTHATLTQGPVQDFNVIADRSTFRPAVTVIQAENNKRVAIHANILAIFAADHDLLIAEPSMASHPLPKGDLFLVEAPQQGDWTVSDGTAIVIQLSRKGVEPQFIHRP